MSYVSRPYTMEQLEELASGKLVMKTPFGQVMPHQLRTAGQREAYELAKQRGYLVESKSNRNVAVFNMFFLWCEAVGRPCAKIATGKSTSNLTLDFITLPYEHQASEDLCNRAVQAGRSYALAQNWPQASNARIQCGRVDWYADNVPNEHAEEMMRRLLAVAVPGSVEAGTEV